MSKSPKKNRSITIRLTEEQYQWLEKHAVGMTKTDFVIERLFDPSLKTPRKRNKHPVKDHALISRVLAKLGATRIANNLNQIAHAANCGALMLNPELRALLIQACADIREMRDMLMKALGLSG